MIREFTHTGNEVTIGEVALSLADFKLLYPTYKLPANAVGQTYQQNKCHRVFYADGSHKDVAEKWPDGDTYIINQYTYLCELQSIKYHNNPRTVPTAEKLIDMSLSERKEAIKTSPYNKISKNAYLLAVKKHRTNLLKYCDWTILPDSPLSEEDKLKWMAYRQELRDLPESKRNPFLIVFPKEPQ